MKYVKWKKVGGKNKKHMKCAEEYWVGYHQMTLKRPMTGILEKDLRILVNGYWMILAFNIGEMRGKLACFGVMELVSHN